MNTTYINRADSTGNTIYPIKENIPALSETGWQLAQVCLWPCSVFSVKEMIAAKKQVSFFIRSFADPYKGYLEFCQRVFLFRHHRLVNPAFTIAPIASRWLNPFHLDGFAESENWFIQLTETRKRLPLYKLELKALAEAILEMAEEPSEKNFSYWLQWFKEKQAHNELVLFTIFCAHDHYKTARP